MRLFNPRIFNSIYALQASGNLHRAFSLSPVKQSEADQKPLQLRWLRPQGQEVSPFMTQLMGSKELLERIQKIINKKDLGIPMKFEDNKLCIGLRPEDFVKIIDKIAGQAQQELAKEDSNRPMPSLR